MKTILKPYPLPSDALPELSCVIPAFNEAENIPTIIEKVAHEFAKIKRTYELIIVDDGSTDETAALALSLATKFPVRLLRLSRNFGKENALTAGLTHARGKAVIIMDADLQQPPGLIATFIKHWDEGYEMVYGVRDTRKDESFFKRLITNTFYGIFKKISVIPITPDAQDFRLIDRKALDALLDLPERNRFMKGLYNWVGFKNLAVPYTHTVRHAGKSTFNFRRLVALAITGITSFSALPLRVWTFVGGLVSMASIGYALFIAGRTLIYGAAVPGWATMVCATLMLGGIQLISVGILGEYVGRIFDEVKQRPNFVVAEDSLTLQNNDTQQAIQTGT